MTYHAMICILFIQGLKVLKLFNILSENYEQTANVQQNQRRKPIPTISQAAEGDIFSK